MENKDRMTLEVRNSMLYVRAEYLTYLGYSKEESEADPIKIVVEAQTLVDGRKVLVFSKPEKELTQEEARI